MTYRRLQTGGGWVSPLPTIGQLHQSELDISATADPPQVSPTWADGDNIGYRQPRLDDRRDMGTREEGFRLDGHLIGSWRYLAASSRTKGVWSTGRWEPWEPW